VARVHNFMSFLKTVFWSLSIISSLASALASSRVIEMVGRSILVTWVNGFLGASLVRYQASSEAFSVRDLGRNLSFCFPASVEVLVIADLDMSTSRQPALQGLEFVMHVAQRLFGSLQAHISKNQALLGWTPPVGLDQGLRLTAHHFLESRRS
jgi:hypothetical protein